MIVCQKKGLKGGLWVEIKCDVCHEHKIIRSSRAHVVLKQQNQYCSPKCAANSPIVQEKQLALKTGRKWSEASRRKKSESMRGEKNPRFGKPGFFLGKHHTEEAKRRQAASKLGRPSPTRGMRKTREQIERVSGKNHHNFGKIDVNWRPWMSTDPDLRKWTYHIKQLFDNCCANCGLSKLQCRELLGTKSFTAHHIAPQVAHPELRLDLNNGVALCRVCHAKAHRLLRQDVVAYEELMNRLQTKAIHVEG